MDWTTAVDIGFAAGIVVAALALAGAALRWAGRFALWTANVLLFAGTVVAWCAYALRAQHPRETAVSAAGLSACLLVGAAALLVRRGMVRADRVDAVIAEAEQRLQVLVENEASERAAELERTLARARADSASLLIDEERRIAEERRAEFAERERELTVELTTALTDTQTQVEQRLVGWAQDLDRAAETTKARIAELAQHQKQLVGNVEAQIAADGDRLAADTEEQRAALVRLRAELDKALEETLALARTEVDTHAAERRRALHELDERLRRRERELLERIEREETDAAQRIRAGIEDVQRRQIEQVARVVERASSSYADEATQQFATLVKTSREDAARRLARELDRSVEVFAREAEAVLAERLAHVGDAGAQRLERRLAEAATELERQRDTWMAGLDARIGDLESDVRRRLEELGADAEAERAVLEARLQELLRRLDAANALS